MLSVCEREREREWESERARQPERERARESRGETETERETRRDSDGDGGKPETKQVRGRRTVLAHAKSSVEGQCIHLNKSHFVTLCLT